MSSSWSSRRRVDVRNSSEDDISKEDDSFASTKDSKQTKAQEATRRKKKKEKNKLARMMENSSENEERRRRFDGSFREEEGISRGWQQAFGNDSAGDTNEVLYIYYEYYGKYHEKPIWTIKISHHHVFFVNRLTDLLEKDEQQARLTALRRRRRPLAEKKKSLNRGGAREVKVNGRLSRRSQRLLESYYENTEFVDSRAGTDDSSAGESLSGDETGRMVLMDDAKKAMFSLQQDVTTERFLDEPSYIDDEEEAKEEKTGLAGMASRAASMVEDLSNKARFMAQRDTTRTDLAAVTSQRRRQRRWQRFDEPGAVQMTGRAYGAPPRPPDSKATRVRELSGELNFGAEDDLLLEDGVKLTSAGLLLEAKPVSEDECAPRAFAENDIAFAQSAPLALKHMLQERHVRRRLVGFCILVALLTMLASVAATHFGKGIYDQSPTGATPTPSPTFLDGDLKESLASYSGYDAFSDPSSPQSRACGWLSTHDKSGLKPNDSGFLQRYVIVLLYFSMGGENWASQDKWLSPELNVCDWSPSIHSATDHSDRPCVTGIDLSRAGLDGTIPSEIGYLDAVESINLAKNNLSGSIPAELFNIESLTELVLSSNILSSTIPSGVSNAKFLDVLKLSDNFIASSIPDELWDLRHLRTLDLSSNELTGTISVRLENLSVLNTLDLRTNMLGGNIPDAISFLIRPIHCKARQQQIDRPFSSNHSVICSSSDVYCVTQLLEWDHSVAT